MRLTDFRLSSHAPLTRVALILFAIGVLLAILELCVRVVAPVPWAGQYHADWGDDVDESLLRRSALPGLAYELIPNLEIECWGDQVLTNQLRHARWRAG